MRNLRLPDLNKVHIAGRLTRDPEVRKTTRGKQVADIGLAYNHNFKDREGNYRDDVNFFKVTAWGRLGELCGDHLSKGSAVMIEGRLTEDSWENENGETRRTVNIVASRVQFLDVNSKNGQDEESEVEEAVQ